MADLPLIARSRGVDERAQRMRDEREREAGWTPAERQALRRLIRMGLILLLAIVIAGTIAALLSSALGGV